ncbi:MAG: dienelactone hydrolase family protein [Planctomycetes bacterium]|nr:dienelactone hydrolase family protein [Planctomycetota bacterium]MBL7106336.1 dienelactone hydrolase family protein [Phycisphaerae bacterium]
MKTVCQFSKSKLTLLCLFALLLCINGICIAKDTLAPLKDGKIPQNLDQLWEGYDPAAEPLDTEILEEWEDNGVICRVLRYRVGIFKGQKAMMGALYAFPKGEKNLPGLVQIHGGGQHANLNAVTTNARRGYACISLNWLANQMTGLRKGQNWKWEGIHTDWGCVDATQNTHNLHFGSLEPDDKTVDNVESPRNNNWFLGVMGARRAVTFLQQQPEVDPSKIGMYGHSMGAKLTFDTSAIDKRIKAAVPSAGAQANKKEGLHGNTIATYAHYPKQTCAVMFLNPSNDFHGRIDDIEKTIDGMTSKEYQLCRTPHLNHRTMPEYAVTGLLWFDKYLKGTFEFPKTPELSLALRTSNGVPIAIVKPDTSKPVTEVDVYFNRGDVKATDRYWELAKIEQKGDIYVASCPVVSTNESLRVFVNVRYPLDKPVTGASYYYQIYTAENFWLSSRMYTVGPDELKAASVKATAQPTNIIEDFGPEWKKKWYSYNYDSQWPFRSHKLKDKRFQAPSQDVKLALDIKCQKDNAISIELDQYRTQADVKGGGQWQTVVFEPSDFKLKEQKNKKQDKPENLEKFSDFGELVLGAGDVAYPDQPEVEVSAGWDGELPQFRDLRWLDGN